MSRDWAPWIPQKRIQSAKPDETLKNQQRGQKTNTIDCGHRTEGRRRNERKEESMRVCAQRLWRSGAAAGGV